MLTVPRWASGIITPVNRLGAFDRTLGDRARRAVARHTAVARGLTRLAAALSPAFRGVVGVLTLLPGTRRLGIRAGAAATASALAAGVLRRRIGRPRPNGDAEPGFPSRHAASASAIVRTVSVDRPRLGVALGVFAAVGLIGRVTSGRHEVGDIAAGAVLGCTASSLIDRIVGEDQ